MKLIRSKGLERRYHTFVYVRLQGTPASTVGYVHPVGAYGVMGFSGVKDARRESFLADASASALSLQEDCEKAAERLHFGCKTTAIRLQEEGKGTHS